MTGADLAVDVTGDVATNGSIRLWLRLLVLIMLICGLGIYESRYLFWGEQTTATITDLRQIAAGQQLKVKFNFRDSVAKTHREVETLPYDRAIRKGDGIEIQYLPGRPSTARVSEAGRPGIAYLFFAIMASALIAFGVLWCYASRRVNERPRNRVRLKTAGMKIRGRRKRVRRKQRVHL